METSPNGSDLVEHLSHPGELTERIELRASKEDVERWRAAGEMRGLTLSAYVRQSARELALHPAIARGAVEGAWLELVQRSVIAIETFASGSLRELERMRAPIDVKLTLHGAGGVAAAAAVPKKKPAKKKPLEMKHANRKKPPARSKR